MKTVFVIDDSATLRGKLRNDLESHGFRVEEAADGKEGLEKILAMAELPSVIICDINMPVIDGLTMVERMQEYPHLQPIPKLMLTTETNATMKARAKSAGVTAWITKPYDKDSLVEVLRDLAPED